jgi:Tol biopolymer transport system component
VGAIFVCISVHAAESDVPVAETKAPTDDGVKLSLESDKTLKFSVDEATWLSLDVSPQGDRLVIEVLGDLYLLSIDGGQAKPLSTGMHFDSQPRFSPDGSRIAFISDRDGQDDLWVMSATDEIDEKLPMPLKLTKSESRTDMASPSWSPDGKSIVVSQSSWKLRTFELWAYHLDGGKGVQITKAMATADTKNDDRTNALGAVYSPDGRYLYYSSKLGGFGYNLQFPQWQVARRDLLTGSVDVLTQSQGSAFRPVISPDGSQLVYGTRYEQQTGLRIRNLETGKDQWLAYPVQRDDQESRFTRDLLPGYAFTPDGRTIITTKNGKLVRIDVQSSVVGEIPFSVDIEKRIATRLYYPYRADVGPVKARIISNPSLSPNGKKLTFSAFSRIYVKDLKSGEAEAISPEGMVGAFPGWSPKGSEVVYVSWQSEGGHIYRQRARKGSKPKRISQHAAYYTHPAWSPDGARIFALRGSGYERLVRQGDYGPVIGSDVIWLSADGSETHVVIPARGLSRPHFGTEPDRIYLQLSAGMFANKGTSSLVSIRIDGTDRRDILSSAGPGAYSAQGEVPSELMQMSPDGQHALIQHANQVYVAALLNATAITMNGDEIIEDCVILIKDGRIMEVGARSDVVIPEEFERRDLQGKFIIPGLIDTHAHYRARRNVPSLSNASFLANLAYGVTTGMDVQPSTIDLISAQDMVDVGLMLGPRVYSTGPGIFSNNEFTSQRHAYGVLKRYRDHYGVKNLKAYISGNRKQRQWLLQAARDLQLMPTTEGSLDMKLDLTHMIDGFSGNEHSLPLPDLYDDVVQLTAQTRIAYTPTLLVNYGGPWTEDYYYTNESPHDDPKLSRYTPYYALAARTLRRAWFHDREYITTRIAQQAKKIVDAGGQVGIGAHGQLQGLGYHWELWSVASGSTNMDASRSATLMGAEMIGLHQDVGSLAAGKFADLVVLNSNPLDNIRNSADIQFVMKAGALYEGDTLDQVWPQEEKLADQWWWHIDPAESLGQ